MTHLSDDETVAKMGHPKLGVGHPAKLALLNVRCLLPLRFKFDLRLKKTPRLYI